MEGGGESGIREVRVGRVAGAVQHRIAAAGHAGEDEPDGRVDVSLPVGARLWFSPEYGVVQTMV